MTDARPARPPARRRLASVWTLALVASVAVVTWMALGPLDEDAPNPEYLTYVIEVPDLPRAVEGLLVLVASLLGVVSIVRIGRSTPDDAPTRPIALVLAIGAATGAGVLIGGSGRAITAGADGANIGAGLALLFVLPFAVVLALVAVAAARHRVPGAATP